MEYTHTPLEWIKEFMTLCAEKKAMKGYKMGVLEGNPADQELIQRIFDNL